MDVTAAFISLGIALGLGLLVGMQRERAGSALAGVRTFPLITLLGTLCAILESQGASWSIAAGLVVVAAATAMGNWLRAKPQESPGITTEVAVLVMYVVGAMLWSWREHREVAVAVGATCAVLLHLKTRLHGLVSRFEDRDVHAIMQFALISLVILPVLPNRGMGPLDAINPRETWWMVVLVVGISLAGYVAYKLVPKGAGAAVGGLLGGMISSTATTASFSRRAKASPKAVWAAATAIAMAWAVAQARVLVEVFVAAPSHAPTMAIPLAILLAAAAGAGIALWLMSRDDVEGLREPSNPTELKSALVFALLYAVVIVLVVAAKKWLGSSGLYVVGVVSGLTDMDAITLSTSRLAQSGGVDPDTAWRVITVAAISNTAFKVGLAWAVGGRRLAMRLAIPVGAVVLVGLGLVLLWPSGEAA